MNLNVDFTPVDNIPARKALGNSRAAEYDRIADQLRKYPNQSFRLVEGKGTQSNVNALKQRGIHAVLRNTGPDKKGDLYAVYVPAEDTPANGDGTTPVAPVSPLVNPTVGDQAPAAVDADGMPVTT